MRGLILGLLAFVTLFIGAFLALGEFAYDYSFPVHRFPIIIGVFTITLSIAAAVRIVARRRSISGTTQAEEGGDVDGVGVGEAQGSSGPDWAWPPGTTTALLWLVAALPVMILFGYVAGAAFYLLAYLKLHGERWLTAIAFAATAAIVVYFGFHEFLGVQLPVTPFWWPE